MPDNNPAHQTPSPGRLWTFRIAKLIVTVTVLVVVAAISFCLAVVVSHDLSSDKVLLSLLSGVLGTVVGLSIALTRKTLGALGELCRWVAAYGWRGFPSRLAILGGAVPATVSSIVFSVALASHLASSKGPELPLEKEIRMAMEAQGYTAERGRLLDKLRWLGPPETAEVGEEFRFPVVFERGRIEEGDEAVLALPEEGTDLRFSAGLGFETVRGRNLITGLLRALGPCGRSGDGRVRIGVQGYASSEPFEGAAEPLSRRLNVQLANERGRLVEGHLRAEIRRLKLEDAIDLEGAEDYKGFGDMEAARRFEDRPGDTPARGNYEQDLLTRAAHIRVLDLGGCAWRGP
jgi:hypothetical protein